MCAGPNDMALVCCIQVVCFYEASGLPDFEMDHLARASRPRLAGAGTAGIEMVAGLEVALAYPGDFEDK